MPTRTFKIPETLYREGTSVVDKKDNTIRLSISSDAPYLRYRWEPDDDWEDGPSPYYEVLDHSEKGLKTTRLQKGTSLLFNHHRDILLGRNRLAGTEKKTEGGKELVRLYVESKISEADDVKSYRTKIDEGILCDASVGYAVLEMEETGEKIDGIPVVRCTWDAHEASLVTIPADQRVGIGRQRAKEPSEKLIEIGVTIKDSVDSTTEHAKSHQSPTTMPEVIAPEKPEQKIDVNREREDAAHKALSDYEEKGSKIRGFIGGLKNEAWKKQAEEDSVEFLKITDKRSFEQFQNFTVPRFAGVTTSVVTPEIGMDSKEKRRYSVLKAIRDMAFTGRLEGLEREASLAAAKQYKRDLMEREILIPEDMNAHDATRERNFDARDAAEFMRQAIAFGFSTRAQTAGSATAGGFTVATTMGSMIELLRNATVLGRVGITELGGLVGDLVMPVHTGGATAYWLSETGAGIVSSATFGQKAMTPKRLFGAMEFSGQFLAQSSISAEQFCRGEIATVLAIELDRAGLHGIGAAGEPLGVFNTPGINQTVTYGGAADWADVVEHRTGIAVDNALIGGLAWILSNVTIGKWQTKLKDSVAGAGYLISDNMTANGFPVNDTNQITGNYSILGAWAQLIRASWAGTGILVNPFTGDLTDTVRLTSNQRHDYLVRQPLAFNVSTDSAAQ